MQRSLEMINLLEASLMNQHPTSVKETLTSLIKEMAASPALFVTDPERDFTRKRKLPFDTVIQLLLSMGGNSLNKELLEAQGYSINTATVAAFVQQRDKILPFALEFLLHEFTQSFSKTKKYKGFRLLAADGSDLHIAADPKNPDTYIQSQPDAKGYSLLHLNALYDLCNRIYVDSCIQPCRCANEHRALADMVDRSCITDNVIVIADRGFEGYNIFAHIENKGWKYVIRVKDSNCSGGILSGLRLPATGEFDVIIPRILTRKQTKEVKTHPELYRYIPASTNFDFLDLHTNKFYPFSFRAVRFKIADDAYETVITNLNQDDFPPEELKELYRKRWGIETSFRELKYAVGLTSFHSKKVEYIAQEIYARMIMYNFSEMITSHVVIQHRDTQYEYQVNFTVAIYICRHFFRSNVLSPDVEALILKNILPIRPGRKDIRKIRYKTAVSFIYRVA
jgi:hypothetical protein